ncbi:MAG: hypothetical protein LCH38_05475 [Proteobacteria bacterium]|nr:hypothetical protein [Pseudomonadota bacterium]
MRRPALIIGSLLGAIVFSLFTIVMQFETPDQMIYMGVISALFGGLAMYDFDDELGES